MQAERAHRGVGDGRTAEGEVEVCERGTAEGEDLGGDVGKGAAE